MSLPTVQLFFACDERYLSLFGVALASVKRHHDPARSYVATVLHTEIPEARQKEMSAYFDERGFSLRFRSVKDEIEALAARLHTRDYYSNATYYRLLIPALYPELTKALYLDSDIILRADVAKLYDVRMGDALAAAVPDGFVNHVPLLRRYVENRVGVPADTPYFNAGVLLMNLVEMRKLRFGELFASLLSSVTFRVAQDQDYLNVICRGRVKFLSDEWNYMPLAPAKSEPRLVHFNLDNKPWQKDGVLYADEFWAIADATPFGEALHARFSAYSEEDVRRDALATERLIATAIAESEDKEENRRIASRIGTVMSAYTEKTEEEGSTFCRTSVFSPVFFGGHRAVKGTVL